MPGQMAEIGATSVMLAMLAVAVVTDLRAGKVYNYLTVPCAVAGLALGAVTGGFAGLAGRVLAMAAVVGAVLFLSKVARLGGGDVKLLMAVAALKGLHFICWTMLLTGVLGGLLALVVTLRRRAMKQTAFGLLTVILSSGGGAPTKLASGSATGEISYSIAIAAGAILALVLGA
jgi:prepilin peptidase CpaA